MATERLRLYRALLRALRTFPSSKRGALTEAVKAEWRDGAAETDVERVQRRLSLASDGLARLRSYGADDVSLAGPLVSP